MHPFQMQKYAFRADGSKKETNDKKQKNTGIVPRIRAHIESQARLSSFRQNARYCGTKRYVIVPDCLSREGSTLNVELRAARTAESLIQLLPDPSLTEAAVTLPLRFTVMLTTTRPLPSHK